MGAGCSVPQLSSSTGRGGLTLTLGRQDSHPLSLQMHGVQARGGGAGGWTLLVGLPGWLGPLPRTPRPAVPPPLTQGAKQRWFPQIITPRMSRYGECESSWETPPQLCEHRRVCMCVEVSGSQNLDSFYIKKNFHCFKFSSMSMYFF